MKASRAVLIVATFSLSGCAMMAAETESNIGPVSPAVKSTIAIGQGPILLAINDDGSQIYAAANNGLHVIDTSDEDVGASLSTVANAAGLALSSASKRAYLTNLFSIQLNVVDMETQSLLQPIELLSQATRPAYGRVAVSKDGSQIYVLDRVGQNLVAVDAAQGTTQNFGLDLRPNDVAVSPDGRWAYICGCKGFCSPGTVELFDTQQNQFGPWFRVGPSPYRVIFDPSGKTVYTANLGDGTVSVVDAESHQVTATIHVAAQLTGLAISNDGRWLYAVSRATNQLAVIDASTNEVRNKVIVGPAPREVVLSSDGGTAYVSTAQSVAVVDTAMLIQGN